MDYLTAYNTLRDAAKICEQLGSLETVEDLRAHMGQLWVKLTDAERESTNKEPS